MKLETRVSQVFAFSDPTSICVIEFPSIPGKIGFYKQLKKHAPKAPHGKLFSFSNNKTFEERTADKHLGFMKYLLIEDGLSSK